MGLAAWVFSSVVTAPLLGWCRIGDLEPGPARVRAQSAYPPSLTSICKVGPWTHLLPRFLRGSQAAGHRLGGWSDVNHLRTFPKPPPSLPIPLLNPHKNSKG